MSAIGTVTEPIVGQPAETLSAGATGRGPRVTEKRAEVQPNGDCSVCGGTHYGSSECPYKGEDGKVHARNLDVQCEVAESTPDSGTAKAVQTAVDKLWNVDGSIENIRQEWTAILTALVAEQEREIETLGNVLQDANEEAAMQRGYALDLKDRAEQAEAALDQARDILRRMLYVHGVREFHKGERVQCMCTACDDARHELARALSGSTDEGK